MNLCSRVLQLFFTLLLLLSLFAIGSSQDKKKISYALFLDNSGSLRTQFDQVLNVGKGVVAMVHERGPVSIFNFTSQRPGATLVVKKRVGQTQDLGLLLKAIDEIYVMPGQTTLRDAIGFIADSFGQDAAGEVASERVIVLVTDGEDRKSKVSQKELIQKLKESHIRVYAIGFVDQLEGSRGKAVEFLTALTKETGGRVVFPKSNREDVQRLLAELAIVTP